MKRTKRKSKHGCDNKRYQENNIENLREYRRQYYLKNKERLRTKHHKYYIANRDKIIERVHQYQIKNRDKIREKSQRYHKENPEVGRMGRQRRRAKKKELPATLTKSEWQTILDQHFGRCHYCGKKTGGLHQEHKIPISKGGAYTKDNIVPSCQSCNSSKYLMPYKEFIKKNEKRLQPELL